MPISLSRNYDNGDSLKAQARLRFNFDELMISLNIVMQMLRYIRSLQTIKSFHVVREMPMYLPITTWCNKFYEVPACRRRFWHDIKYVRWRHYRCALKEIGTSYIECHRAKLQSIFTFCESFFMIKILLAILI